MLLDVDKFGSTDPYGKMFRYCAYLIRNEILPARPVSGPSISELLAATSDGCVLSRPTEQSLEQPEPSAPNGKQLGDLGGHWS